MINHEIDVHFVDLCFCIGSILGRRFGSWNSRNIRPSELCDVVGCVVWFELTMMIRRACRSC